MQYTKKDFCELVGIAPKHLPMYFERGKIAYVDGIHTGKGARIDSEEPINDNFIAEKQRVLAGERKVPLEVVKPVFKPVEPQKEVIPTVLFEKLPETPKRTALPPINRFRRPILPVKEEIVVKNDANRSRFDVDTEIKDLDRKKKELEIDIATIKKDKISGSVVPTAYIIPLFKLQNTAILDACRYAIDEFIKDAAAIFSLDNEDIALLRAKTKKSVNKAADTAQEEGIRNIAILVTEFSEKRGAGDRT